MEERTFDSVMKFVNDSISKREVIDVNTWLDVAQSLNALLENEQNKLFELEKEVAESKMVAIEAGDTVAKAKIRVETSPLFMESRKQKAKVERAIELIRISKQQARLTNDNYHNQ